MLGFNSHISVHNKKLPFVQEGAENFVAVSILLIAGKVILFWLILNLDVALVIHIISCFPGYHTWRGNSNPYIQYSVLKFFRIGNDFMYLGYIYFSV